MRMLIPYEDIEKRVREMAHVINNDYINESITVVCVLKGAVMFFSDLVRHLKSPIKYEFLSVSSYGGSETPQTNPIVDLSGLDIKNITNQNVLVVEDVIGTGETVKTLVHTLQEFSPKTLRIVALIDKTQDGINFGKIEVDSLRLYLGYRVDPDVFIIGYGMDNDGLMRNQMDITTKRSYEHHITVEKLNGSMIPVDRIGDEQ